MSRQTIGFYGIVRDEAKNINAMLEALEPVCSHYTIIDTGSVDRTKTLVRKWLKTHDGTLTESPWVDFAHNLNEALPLAREISGCTYLLHLGARNILHRHGRLPKLTERAYYIAHDGDSPYSLPLLHRADLDCEYIGATHTYLAIREPTAPVPLAQLTIEDRGYDDDRPAKLERDRVLLERMVLDDPANPRWTFYLAQTYRCQGELLKAAEWYARRRQLAGYDEEVFYAMFMEGWCRRNTHLLLMAWQYRPTRAEPIRAIARIYREAGDELIAASFDSWADAIPVPTGDMMLVHLNDYKQAA